MMAAIVAFAAFDALPAIAQTTDTIDQVVVTATKRDRSRQMFRRHVKKIPTHEWYTGFKGNYELRFAGERQWRVRGKFERNHLPGDDINSLGANTFILTPDPSSNPVPDWQIQRYLLLMRGIAERAVQLGENENSNRGMTVKHRGTANGRNVFLVVKPYFDSVQGAENSFQTTLHVNEASGIVYSSQTISRTKWGVWNVYATYAVHAGGNPSTNPSTSPSGGSSGGFIYPTSITGHYYEKTPTSDETVNLDATINTTEVYTFTPETTPQK